MKKILPLLILALLLITSCKTRDNNKDKIAAKTKEFHNKDFNWTIAIPEGFKEVPPEEWAKMQNRGANVMKKTMGQEIDMTINKNIFIFQHGRTNYFEASQQAFDSAVDGDYREMFHAINDITYTSLHGETGASIDTSYGKETIDNLEFQTFKLKMKLDNSNSYNVLMFSRLFGKKDFCVNIMYVDEKIGQQMLQAMRSSKFGKIPE